MTTPSTLQAVYDARTAIERLPMSKLREYALDELHKVMQAVRLECASYTPVRAYVDTRAGRSRYTLCAHCLKNAPSYVDVNTSYEVVPDKCDLCGYVV